MKLKRKKLKWFILMSFCTSLVGMPAAFAENLNIITQDDYNSAKDVNGDIFPTNSSSNNVVTIGRIGNGTVPAFDVVGTEGFVYGGYDVNGTGSAVKDVTGNVVTINSGSNISEVYGGYSKNGTVSGNTVTVNRSITTGESGSLYGVSGGCSDTGNANNNTVIINKGATIGWEGAGSIEGGGSGNGTANNNIVTINGGTIGRHVSGGRSSAGANNNIVTINGGTIGRYVSGGSAFTGAINNNVVIINDGIIGIDDPDASNVIGGACDTDGTATVNNNAVTITGGTIKAYIYGGFGSTGTAVNTNNTVTITGGTVEKDIAGGVGGTTTDNTVTITGGIVTGDIIGGVGTAVIKDNTVTITGGTIAGNIIGGMGVITDTGIKNNIITINPIDNLDISIATLYGSTILTGFDNDGNKEYSPLTHDQDSNGNQLGNTLNVYGKGITAKNVVNFSNINFYLPSSIQNQDTALTLTDTTGTDISYSTVKAGVVGNANLNKGDKIYLLTNANGLTTTGTTYGKLTEGVRWYNYLIKISRYMGHEN